MCRNVERRHCVGLHSNGKVRHCEVWRRHCQVRYSVGIVRYSVGIVSVCAARSGKGAA